MAAANLARHLARYVNGDANKYEREQQRTESFKENCGPRGWNERSPHNCRRPAAGCTVRLVIVVTQSAWR